MPNEDEDVEEEKSLLDPDLRVENGYMQVAIKRRRTEVSPKLPPRVPSTPPELPRQPQISDDLKERILDNIDSIDNPSHFQQQEFMTLPSQNYPNQVFKNQNKP